ncbi:hypothetical protein Dimus_015106 [Dionaea muscipula]
MLRRLIWHTKTAVILNVAKRQLVSQSSSFLHIDSYCKFDDSSQVYASNRAICDGIRSGSLSAARQLFDQMSVRDAVSWNILISGYKRHGLPEEALEIYSEMIYQGAGETASTLSCVLSICSNSGFYFEGFQVHCRVISLGFGGNLYIGSSIVDLYMSMGLVDVGLHVFAEMPVRNVAVWNLVLRGFAHLGLWGELLGLYPEMKLDGLAPNAVTISYLIHGCCNGGFVEEGKQLHSHAIKTGLVESNLFVANGLVDFYSACGSLLDAQRSFDVIPLEDVISWNSIVSAYADHDLLSDALEYFGQMQLQGMRPSVHSFICLLNSCSASRYLLLGRQLHGLILKNGFYEANTLLQSALIDMYGKCSDIESSVNVYDSSAEKTMECCNALMVSLLHSGLREDVVELFCLMVDEGIGFDEVSLSITMKALSFPRSAGLIGCKLLHGCATKSGFESDIAVSCSLIDAYSKCGQLELSCRVFESLPSPNLICFTSIINGYARNGMGRKCLELLDIIIQKGLDPDRVTFLCVLIGCNHSGLVEEGRFVFNSMKIRHGINPDRQHYSCMVDLLGRAGLLYEAEELLKHSPVKVDSSVMWSSLLRSCRVHQNEMIGQRVAKRLMELEPGDPAACPQTSSFYFDAGDFDSSMHYSDRATWQWQETFGCSSLV